MTILVFFFKIRNNDFRRNHILILVDVSLILILTDCKMFTRKLVKVKFTHKSLPTAWRLSQALCSMIVIYKPMCTIWVYIIML